MERRYGGEYVRADGVRIGARFEVEEIARLAEVAEATAMAELATAGSRDVWFDHVCEERECASGEEYAAWLDAGFDMLEVGIGYLTETM